MKKVLIMLAVPLKPFEQILSGWEIVYPQKEAFTQEELLEKVKDVDAIVSVFGNKLSNDVIDAAPKLKMIANFGAGYDNVDMVHANAKGIVVTNSPNPVTEPTAELAMGLMISVARRMGEMNRILKNKEDLQWGVMRNLSTTLVGKQLGIVGMGAIGKALARRAVASGMSIVYHNRKKVDTAVEAKLNAKYLPLDELLQTSDVVSLNMPLTPETKQMIGKQQLQMMKSSGILINTARGPVVDEEALIEALENKGIAGAGLDVFDSEPTIPNALRELTNVVLMPHLGSGTHEAREEMSGLVALNVKTFFEGATPPNQVN
ncbi:NAD(P)-dependent oxidoreductase [Carboxylicivirga sp. M1479]|uniref:NAD(P)-dependent oxidoreductase n=1 Tax=Carboxylicivirga sp. M1479 TaxID=2594476 RepID=UPI0011778595|nr:NAD(P)-dependent oxidoreductase [Carboxylicivirga sp. M1479]TRX70920.1 hydroxyacid dehydrogenase [Carboxylicivirga sp. M1479]